MENSLFETLAEVLKQDDRFVSHEWDLLKNTIRDKAESLDENLISLLLDNELLRAKFFVSIKDVIVFDAHKFIKLINNKEFLPDSFTSFKNKIGLTNKQGDFIASSNEVVLSFPFKDCVLAGGQDKEDSKRDEIFYNEILGSDDIDRLFDKKVFTNFKRIDKDGEHTLKGFNRNEEWTITDNLIIKGNNLLALHSLKSNFAWKVKLIYIDPPYNTQTDSFKYNDKFNHSTWLTFMKNRLEVAKDLLRDDGVIFVQCDHNEDAYLKVLMDDIFWMDNFIANIAVKSSTPSWIKTAHKNIKLIKQKDTILMFKKNILEIKAQYTPRENWDTHYSLFLEKDGTRYTFKKLLDVLKEKGFLYQRLDEINPTNEDIRKFICNNRNNICRLQSHKNKEIEELSRNKYRDIVYEDIEWNEIKGLYFNGQVITMISNWIKKIATWKTNKEYWSMLLCDFWWDIDFQNTQNEWWVSLTNWKKPEALLYRVIEMSTNPWDIVLDYHLWSGTTCAVAHKMGRQYIGIEQMDYIETISVERMKKVIEWEQGGITKSVEWKWGGEFVYMEIMQANQKILNQINQVSNIGELLKIYEQIKESEFINYSVDTGTLDLSHAWEESFDDMKLLLIEILDKNLLYVNYSERNDRNSGVSEEDKSVNEGFYNL